MEDQQKKFLIIEWDQEMASVITKLDRILQILETSRGSKSIAEFKFLNNSDVMQSLGISASTLQKLRNNGKINFSQVGHKIFYKQSDLEQFISKNSTQDMKP